MNNLILRLLDRQTLGDHFFRGAQHIPFENDKEKVLRSALGLRAEVSPFNALVIIRAIDAFSYLRASVPEETRTYDTLFTQTPLFASTGNADLVPDKNGRTGVFRQAEEWPVVQDILIEETSATSVRISLPGLKSDIVEKTNETGGLWRVEWPAWSGVYGLLDPKEQSLVTISHRPVSAPFSVIRQNLNSKGWDVLEIISEAGFLELFNKTSLDAEAVAAAAVSLALHNDDILFEV